MAEIRQNLTELINDTIMSGQSAIIVEGYTDIQIYNNILGPLRDKIYLKPVELIDGYNSGCDAVFSVIEKINDSYSSVPDIHSKICGIIDKDVRDYRNTIPHYNNLLVLKYYSIESHFVCAEALESCVENLTWLRNGKFVAQRIFDKFCANLEDIFLFSLEALRGAVETDYVSEFGYSQSLDSVKNDILKRRIYEKKDDLTTFASQKGISCNVNSVKSFSKGKELLKCFSEVAYDAISRLRDVCGNDPTYPDCDYCKAGLNEKCLYRKKPGLNKSTALNYIIGSTSIDDLSYIYEWVQIRTSSH